MHPATGIPSPSRAEPYGAVQRRGGSDPSLGAPSYYAGAASGGYPYMATPATATATANAHAHAVAPAATTHTTANTASVGLTPLAAPLLNYQHSRVTLVWALLPLLLLLWNSHTLLLQVFLFVTLALYALDLANAKEATWMGLWLGWAVLTGTNAWLLSFSIFRILVDAILFLCLACWCTLQLQWVSRDMPVLTRQLQSSLHFLLPPVAASVVTDICLATSQQWGRLDRAATGAPHLFALLLVSGMWFVGALPENKEQRGDKRRYILLSRQARWHSILLLLVPPLMHLATFRRRIASFHASYDELFEIVLVWSVPYLLHYALHTMQLPEGGPYTVSWLFARTGGMTLRGAFVPMLISLLASLALQQAYLIPICQTISYQFNGHQVASGLVTSAYLTLATLASLTAAWVWGRKSSQTNEPLFGEYHEDVVQLGLASTGLFLGKAFGMSWSMTPLPILAFLGLSVWFSTRMLRYLAIFLFVAHSTGLVVFSYRFAGIQSKITMAVPGMELGLIRFGMLIISSSCLVGLVAGLAVRSRGGTGADILKKLDVPGILLLLYTLLLTALEATLLDCPIPFRDLMGIESHDSDEDAEEMMYDPLAALMTSAVISGITWFMQRYKIISIKSAVAVWSTSLGKAIAVFVDMNEVELDPSASIERESEKQAGFLLLLRALAASLMIVVMMAPRAFLHPVHLKSGGGGARYKRAPGPSGKPASLSSPNSNRTIAVYCLLILPGTLVASIPFVLKPLVGVLSGHYSGVYYVSSPAMSELVGFAMALWGVSSLSMINHLLPDGGGEIWKKAAALTFLMGVGVAVSAPTLPGSGADSVLVSNPYALISSSGSRLVSAGRTRIGGWGLLSASLGTLLAITGPLELRERRDPSGQKDTLLLFRLMVFSLMFGCGVAWFITMECMSEEGFLAIFVTATACMAISFFGTVVGVLGYFLELQNFDEVTQVAKVWAGAFPVFGLLAGTTQFVKGAAHPFGMGGWLSTYLTMCSFVGLAISLVLRSRSARNTETRGLGNLSCILSWVCSVIVCYGRYGVAGLDVSFEMVSVFGISASVLGTFLTSLILLALEGEKGSSKRTKIQRMGGTSKQGPATGFGFTFSNLGPSNKMAPTITATVTVLLLASVYTIFFRGCGWISAPTSADDVLAGVQSKRAGDDLASIVKANILHSQAIATSAKLAGSGFWTADNIMGPLLHLGGLIATLPSLYLLLNRLWSAEKIPPTKILLSIPLNVIPLVLCKGIPTLQTLSIVGLVGGIVQFVLMQQTEKQSKMRI